MRRARTVEGGRRARGAHPKAPKESPRSGVRLSGAAAIVTRAPPWAPLLGRTPASCY